MYNLNIQAQGNPSPFRFKFDKKEEAFAAADKAMRDGYHQAKDLAIVLGDGSILNITSDEGDAKAAKAMEDAKRSGGLIQTGRFEVKKEDFVLHIQMGVAQLPPLSYKTAEARKAAIDETLKTRRLHYVFEEGHDHLFIMIGSGIALMNMSGEMYIAKRREAIEMMQKQMAAAAAQQQQGGDPRILLPFGGGPRR